MANASELLALSKWEFRIPKGRWRHHKGGYYQVVGFVWLDATAEWGVLYMPEHPEHMKLVARSCREWIEDLPTDDSRVTQSRFFKVPLE